MQQMIAALLAQLIERVFKNYVTTIATVLGITATVLGQYTTVFPPKYQNYVSLAGLILAGVAGALAHDEKSPAQGASVPMNKITVLLLFAFAATLASAQTGLTASSDAMAVNYKGQWSAGTLVTQSFDLIDLGAKKTNRLFIEGNELPLPGPGINMFMGGVKLQPDLSNLISKTNISPSNFSTYVRASVGNGLPSTGNSRISWMIGGGMNVRLADSLQWQSLQFHYGRFGADPFYGFSTGLSYFFGGSKAPTANAVKK